MSKKAASEKRARIPRILLASVLALQAAVLGTLALTSLWQPPPVRMLEVGWVWLHAMAVYPLLVLLVGGPALSWLCLKFNRRMATPLLASWIIFGVVLIMGFGLETQTLLAGLWHSTHLG